MRHRLLASLAALTVATLVASFGAATVSAQSAAQKPATAAKTYTPARTADGQPDLQGVWDYRTLTPMERPAELADKAVLTDAELAAFEKQTNETRDKDRRDGSADADVGRAYNQFWWDFGSKVTGNRTSLVTDPPDGKIPPLTKAGQDRQVARRNFQDAGPRTEGSVGRGFDSYEDRPLQERCLSWSVSGPPMVPGAYNNNVQLIQSRDYVVIVNEMIHDHRIVALDGSAHLTPGIRQWMGDSRGHFEGNTLVVDTTNFSDKRTFRAAGENMHLIERFTRVGPDSMLYEFTVDDPATYTKSWTAAIPMTRNPEHLFEYACHEGNYAMSNGLSGARNNEKAASDAARKGSN
jgi:hypothetical protein